MWREVRDWFEELACRAGLDGLPSAGRAVAIVLCVVGVCAAGYYLSGPAAGTQASPAPPPASTDEASTVADSEPAAPATITVHVVGEVAHPGVYVLPAGSRAVDAVEAAGGMLGDADQAAINLAREVTDGEQLYVSRQGETPPAGAGVSTGGASGGSGGKIDLNTATPEQLDSLPGVGPSTAQKIVADREANGPFRTVDDLMRVSGIGPTRFEALKDLITVR